MGDTSESEDSDKELQIAFSKGLLKGKTLVETQTKKTFINNVSALKETLEEVKNDLPWVERMDITAGPLPPPKPLLQQLGSNPDDLSGDEIHNDLKRELKFHRQAQAAVLTGIPRLHKLNVPTRRPDDSFAEMVKSDEHMKKIREKLVAKQLSIERSEKAKKLRELRKFGKKVQQEVSTRRQKEKKDMMEAVKKYRKGQTKSLDFLEEKRSSKKSENQQPPKNKKEIFQPNKKRKFKNEKFGFGGQKKRLKQNTKNSVDDVHSSFSAQRNAAMPNKFKQKKQAKKSRPGKQMRQKQKNKSKSKR